MTGASRPPEFRETRNEDVGFGGDACDRIDGSQHGAGRRRRRDFVQEVVLPCHDAGEGAKIKLGPPLNGLDGRTAGSFSGFNYSDANKNSGITWNEDSFKEYIKSPAQKIPGTRMAFAGIKDDKEIDNLWAYLKQFETDGKKK